MKIAVKNLDNKQVREIELPEAVFGYPYKEHLIHEAVQAYLAGLRAGTHKTKTRAEVSGSGKKLWKQKGTGRARIGRHPQPAVAQGRHRARPGPAQLRQGPVGAREEERPQVGAVAASSAEQSIVVVESLELDSHKTKELAGSVWAGWGSTGKALLVDSRDNQNLALASRNNPALKTVDALAVNVYDVVDRAYPGGQRGRPGPAGGGARRNENPGRSSGAR